MKHSNKLSIFKLFKEDDFLRKLWLQENSMSDKLSRKQLNKLYFLGFLSMTEDQFDVVQSRPLQDVDVLIVLDF